MTGWQQLLTVARRDFVERGRSKAFLGTMALVVIMVAGVVPFIAGQSTPDTTRTVAVVAPVPAALTAALDVTGQAAGLTVTTEGFPDAAAAEASLADGTSDVALLRPGSSQGGSAADPLAGTVELVWHQRADPVLTAVVSAAVTQVDRAATAASLGVDPAVAARLTTPTPTTERVLADDPQRSTREGGAFVGSLLLYLGVALFGQFIMSGVVEEKASRVVEVVLSRVPAHRLLAGKVLGIGALGVIQVAVLAGAIYLAARRLLPAEALPALGWDLVLPVIAWFLIGFTFYAVIYAALGATVTRQEDLQGVGMIPVLLILPGYLIALMATGSPDALLVEVASFVPVTSPFVMPVRAAVAGIPAWEVAVSVVILLVTTWLTIRWAGRVYSGAILSIGQRVRLRDAWRGRSA